MKKNVLNLVLFGAASAFALGLAPSAHARALGGFAGSAVNPSQAGDFSENWGTVQHHGAAVESWEVQLPVDNTGNYSPNLSVNPNGSYLECGAAAVSADGASQSWTNNKPASYAYGFTWLNPGTVYVQGGWFLIVGCQMGDKGQLGSITW
jgi:hypothetical protein